MRQAFDNLEVMMAAALLAVFVIPAYADPSSGSGSSRAQSRDGAQSERTWTPSRTPDGQPDVQGIWRSEGGWPCSVETGLCPEESDPSLSGRRVGVARAVRSGEPVTAIVDPPDGRIPYQPWAVARKQEIQSRYNEPLKLRDIKPEIVCVTGIPYQHYSGREFRIVQTKGQVVMAWERTAVQRVIPIDGRPRVAPNVKLYLGDARGRWEGNTLVVETTNLKDWSWLDNRGSFHSDAMTLVERFAFTDADTMSYSVTVQDPKVFTRPWTMVHSIKRANGSDEDQELWEYACVEGERSLDRMLPASRK